MHLPPDEDHPQDGQPVAVQDILLTLARSKAAEIDAGVQRDGADFRRLWAEAADLQALFAELVRLERGDEGEGGEGDEA